jgi:negative regulator of flagellin synthesis FlgM
MKIGKNPEAGQADALARASLTPRSGAAASQDAAAGSATKKVDGQSSDTVQLSAQSLALSSAAAAASESGSVTSQQKIAEVRQAIAEGRFNVNAQVVAERMISQAAELLQSLTVRGPNG